MSAVYALEGAGVRLDGADVLQSVSLAFEPGEFVAIGGPNGAGKSTLISLLAGLRTPTSGRCLFHGRDAYAWQRREFARKVAVVTQGERAAFPFTTADVIYMGRMPHRVGFGESAEDDAAVERALGATGMAAFRDREFRTLSGGEQQRGFIASALAQSSEVLLLDEPATYLDLRHQLSLYQLFRELSRKGMLVIAVTHDLNLAGAFVDRLVLLSGGRVCADGSPAEVLRRELISEIFETAVEVHHTPAGRPWVIYGE